MRIPNLTLDCLNMMRINKPLQGLRVLNYSLSLLYSISPMDRFQKRGFLFHIGNAFVKLWSHTEVVSCLLILLSFSDRTKTYPHMM